MNAWRWRGPRLAGLVLAGAAALAGCMGEAFDPLLGPRRPKEGAERYLATRPDLSEFDKQRLIEGRPIAPALLADLARSPSREVRAFVAVNPATPPDTLAALAADRDIGVRQYLAPHPRLPRPQLDKLLADPSALVRDAAIASPSWSVEELWAMQRQGLDRAAIASNPNAPADLLMALSRGPASPMLNYRLARSPRITPEIEALVLAEKSDDTGKLTLLNNPRVSCATLRRLTQDSAVHIARAARFTLERRQEKTGSGCGTEGP
jgi:hypothetical protein